MIRAFASLPLVAVISCDTIVNPTQTVTVTNQGPAAGTSPGAVVLEPGAFDQVVVEVFESTCPDPPRFVAGCVARITATPKLRGVEVPAQVHGENCNWFLDGAPIAGTASTQVASVSRTPNAFNLAVVALAPGTFRLEAQVMAVNGAKTFIVQ